MDATRAAASRLQALRCRVRWAVRSLWLPLCPLPKSLCVSLCRTSSDRWSLSSWPELLFWADVPTIALAPTRVPTCVSAAESTQWSRCCPAGMRWCGERSTESERCGKRNEKRELEPEEIENDRISSIYFCVPTWYSINWNAPSGGMNDSTFSFSHRRKRMHGWKATSSNKCVLEKVIVKSGIPLR